MRNIILLFFITSSINYTFAGVYTNQCRLKWGNGCIPFLIDPNISDRESEILDAVDIINTRTNAALKRITEPISEEYIRIVPGGGCSSFIGKVKSGQQLTLAPGCPLYTIIHEFMHAFGIYHEQSRQDREDYITINFENIQPGRENNFEIAVDSDITPAPFDAYDYNSVMHYSEFAFSKNGRPTIDARGNDIGNRNSITQLDIQTINNAILACGSGGSGEIPQDSVCEEHCVPSCRNGGVCENGVCNCENTKFSGDTCKDTAVCSPICRNNGICIDGDCNCENTGYTGETCSIPVCKNRCQNNGACVSPNTCDCTGTGYTGNVCNIPLCEQTCRNGGRCVAPNVCDCTGTGYIGNECEIKNCNTKCKNGGKCVGNGLCNCNGTGYSGTLCEIPICREECVFGECSEPDICDCGSTGYIGKVCDIPICDTECINGICVSPNNCVCNRDWQGDTCEVPKCEPECGIGEECIPGNECRQVSILSFNYTLILGILVVILVGIYIIAAILYKNKK